MNRVVLIGAGGHAKVVISTVRAAGGEIVSLVDDDATRTGDQVLGITVCGTASMLDDALFDQAIIAIGSNERREHVASTTSLRWATVIHPRAFVHESVQLGPGTVVFAGAVIQADAVIGAHVIVNTGATIDHDCRIGDFAHVAPGVHLAGNVRVGKGCLIGIGSCAIPGIHVGDRATVGAGSVIVRDIPAGTVAFGSPARAT